MCYIEGFPFILKFFPHSGSKVASQIMNKYGWKEGQGGHEIECHLIYAALQSLCTHRIGKVRARDQYCSCGGEDKQERREDYQFSS